MTIHLGRLKKVDLREFFKDEAKDFTPWLAQEENLELLGETLQVRTKHLWIIEILMKNHT